MFALPCLFSLLARNRQQAKLFQFMVKRDMCTVNKPPNVLIYTGVNNEQYNADKFKKTKDVLGQCLDQDKYVIYQLQHNHITSQPWQENTSLLVLVTDQNLEQSLKDVIDDYVNEGGRLLSVCGQYTLGALTWSAGVDKISELQDVTVCKNLGSSVKSLLGMECMDAVFEVEKSDGINVLALGSTTSQAVIVSVLHGNGMAILSSANILDGTKAESESDCKKLLKDLLIFLGLTCSDPKKSALTNAYLFGNIEDKRKFFESIKNMLKDGCFKENDFSLLFSTDDQIKEEMSPSPNLLPIVTSTGTKKVSFSFASYQDFLETKHLGRLMIYSEVVTSTQTILNGSKQLIQRLPEGCGLVVVGRQQTLGKGRGGNDWLSPDGCLSFSFPVKVDLDSKLGSHLPFLQHMAALAVIEAVRSLENYEDIELRIKWPNDIYFQRDTKIGGILVNSSVCGKTVHAVIGIGVNLDNSVPTTCINEILEREGNLSERKLNKLSREELLARILNAMEGYVEDFQVNGPKNMLIKYYKRWLHSDAQVILESLNGEEVTIKGLDDMGFLSVVTRANQVISVQPDGNSFDMMKNLIAMKTWK